MIDEKGNEVRPVGFGKDWVAFGLREKEDLGYIVADDDGSGWCVIGWFGPGEQHRSHEDLADSCGLV